MSTDSTSSSGENIFSYGILFSKYLLLS
jgi:hypothetical protein